MLTRRQILAAGAAQLAAPPPTDGEPVPATIERPAAMPLAAGSAQTPTRLQVPARMGDQTVQVQLDLQGVEVLGDAPSAGPLQVGLSTAEEHYTKWHTAFPGIAGARVFSPPGAGLKPWSSAGITRLPSGCEPWVSFKDYPTDAAFLAYVKACPQKVKLSWFHERDNNLPQDHAARMDFFARQRNLADIVKAAGNPLVEFMSPPQTLQWTASKTSGGKTKGDGNWRLWWPGSAKGSVWDCYVDSWATAYPDVEKFFAIPVEAAEGTGQDLYISEVGSIRLPSDPSGAGRASWITDVFTYLSNLRNPRVRCAYWWCEIGTGGRVITLDDKPSADAFRAQLTA